MTHPGEFCPKSPAQAEPASSKKRLLGRERGSSQRGSHISPCLLHISSAGEIGENPRSIFHL